MIFPTLPEAEDFTVQYCNQAYTSPTHHSIV